MGKEEGVGWGRRRELDGEGGGGRMGKEEGVGWGRRRE